MPIFNDFSKNIQLRRITFHTDMRCKKSLQHYSLEIARRILSAYQCGHTSQVNLLPEYIS